MTVQRPPGHVEIRCAAAGILYRETEKTVNIYLARRYPGASFFPGYYAFVGGTLEQGDGDPEQDETFRLCVLREFMEELGVMIGKKGDVNPADKEDVRENLREGSMTVREGFDRMGRDPAPECMKPAGRFLTPDFVPVRYDTKYYAVPCPEGVEPDVRGPELTSGAWFTPEGALEKWRRGEMLIAPPVLLLLRSFAEKGFSKGLEEWAGVNTAGTDREPYIEMRPGIRFLPLETPTIPPSRTTNTIVIGEDPFYVVDPGTPHEKEREQLRSLIDRMRRNGEFKGILLTHHHPDHTGALPFLLDHYDVPVHAHEKSFENMDGPPPDQRILSDGHMIDLDIWEETEEEWKLEALHTPGHSEGHLCFHDHRTGTLLAGDMVAGMGTIVIDPPEGDMSDYMESLQRLLNRNIDVILPAHGPFHDHAREVLRQYINHREEREQKLWSALGKTPVELDSLLPDVYGDVEKKYWNWAERTLLAHLKKLKKEGRARKTDDGKWGKREV